MSLEGINIGFGITGSFCTFDKIIPELQKLVSLKTNVYPIFSYNAADKDTRYGKASDWIAKVEEIAGRKSIFTIEDAEPIGPKSFIDILVIAPCTGKSQIQNNQGTI